MPKITPGIKHALSSLIESEGSALELSRKTKISHSTFSKYMSGKIQKINQANWKLLAPLLLPFLPEADRISVMGDNVSISTNSGVALGVVHGNVTNLPKAAENSAIPADVLNAILSNKTMSAVEKADCITALMGKIRQ